MGEQPEYLMVHKDKLQPCPIRELREGVLTRLRERITDRFNPARPLTILPANGEGMHPIVDGHHRFHVGVEVGITEFPCLLHNNGENHYSLAIQCNQDEDTYAPMDLFDWLDIIKKLKDEGKTQKEIGEIVGWSQQKVSDYTQIINKITADVLDFTKLYQSGRAVKNTAGAVFNFTEGWFRDSGLYNLPGHRQMQLMEWFIKERKANATKNQLGVKIKYFEKLENMIQYASENLQAQDGLNELLNKIENDHFLRLDVLIRYIDRLNDEANNKLIHGDAITVLKKLDVKIDLVITDPPYGIEFVSNHRIDENNITKPIINDNPDDAFRLLDNVCALLENKVQDGCHLYFFTSWKVYPEICAIVSKYFTVLNVLIWDKGNWSMGNLEGNYGEQYEMIIFAVHRGNRGLNTVNGKDRHPNIIKSNRIGSSEQHHPMEKPVDLMEFLIQKSSHTGEVVVDPFMGVGSTCVACKKQGRHFIGIEIDKNYFEIAKERVMIGE